MQGFAVHVDGINIKIVEFVQHDEDLDTGILNRFDATRNNQGHLRLGVCRWLSVCGGCIDRLNLQQCARFLHDLVQTRADSWLNHVTTSLHYIG